MKLKTIEDKQITRNHDNQNLKNFKNLKCVLFHNFIIFSSIRVIECFLYYKIPQKRFVHIASFLRLILYSKMKNINFKVLAKQRI